MQMTSRTIVINFAEHQQNGRKLKANPQAKKEENRRKLEPGNSRGMCRVFEFEIFAIANPVVFVTGHIHKQKYIYIYSLYIF